MFLEHIEDANADFGFISETWLHSEKNDVTSLVKDKGYLLRHVIRKNSSKDLGGGVGILIKNTINHKQIPCKLYSSFEHMMLSTKLRTGARVILITLYRLQEISYSTFFNELTELLESVCAMSESFIMSGDINFHLDNPNDPHVIDLYNLLDSFNCIQHIPRNIPTHRKGHTLDFILTREQSPVISDIRVDDVNLSDHFLITFKASYELLSSSFKTFSYRDLKNVDIDLEDPEDVKLIE